MNRNTIVLLLVSAVFMIAGIALFQAFGNSQQAPTTKNPAINPPTSLASIPLTNLDGREQLLGDFQQPVLIVNFWAPWCVPCRREVPALIEIQKQFGEQVQILGLALDGVENIKAFADEHGMNYPSFLAGSKITMYNAVFGNKSGSLPFTVFLDSDRNLGYQHTGELSFEELREKIVELL
jgi:thiol-disulfide isomerase/thioredoxin